MYTKTVVHGKLTWSLAHYTHRLRSTCPSTQLRRHGSFSLKSATRRVGNIIVLLQFAYLRSTQACTFSSPTRLTRDLTSRTFSAQCRVKGRQDMISVPSIGVSLTLRDLGAGKDPREMGRRLHARTEVLSYRRLRASYSCVSA